MKIFKGSYRDCRKSRKGIAEKGQEISSNTGMQIVVCLCYYDILYKQWMCLGMQRHTHR